MLKRLAMKKFIIISLSFLILLIIYFFPSSNEYNIKTTLTYTNPKTLPIYLIDDNDLVSRFEVIKKSENILDTIDEIINNLTINKDNTSHIPNNFKKILPIGTKLLSKELEGNLLKLNFSKELLNITKENEEKMIESLIYSLTELQEVKKIMIFVEKENLKKLPNSQKSLPLILDRNYGINKVYEIESMKDISKITTYYVSKIDDYSYFTPITTISNNQKEKIEIIIEKLKSSPTYQTNLVSYLTASANLLNYEILENSINLSFNNEILSLEEDKVIEEVKYSIALSVRDTYDISKTIFYVDNMLIDALFV